MGDDKSAEAEEQINRQGSRRKQCAIKAIRFSKMKQHDNDSGKATQPVQHFITLFFNHLGFV